MVDVDAAHADVAERPDAGRDGVRHAAGDEKGGEERHRGQEEPFVTRLGEVAAIERERRDRRAQPEVAQDDDEGGGGDRHRQQRRPEPARRHPVRRARARAMKASSVSTSRRSAQTLSRP